MLFIQLSIHIHMYSAFRSLSLYPPHIRSHLFDANGWAADSLSLRASFGVYIPFENPKDNIKLKIKHWFHIYIVSFPCELWTLYRFQSRAYACTLTLTLAHTHTYTHLFRTKEQHIILLAMYNHDEIVLGWRADVHVKVTSKEKRFRKCYDVACMPMWFDFRPSAFT